MSPRLLFIGAGSGSWQVRGVQLGRSMGARVTTAPTPADFAWADVIVLVKRAIDKYGAEAKQTGKCMVWDALDFWQQPEDNTRSVSDMAQAVEHLRVRFGVTTVIGATRAMAEAVGGIYLPHHHRPGLIAGGVEATLKTVAYEGTRKYLGSWGKALETVCGRLGLRFLINPPDLNEADLVVGFRGEHHDGDLCRQWKSGVKIVNAMRVGRPILSQPCSAFAEIQPPGETVASQAELEAAIVSWQSLDRRMDAFSQCLKRVDEFSLETVARHYTSILNTAWRCAA